MNIEERYYEQLYRSGRSGCGKYQVILFLLLSVCCYIGCSVVLYGFALFEMMPKFECQADNLTWQVCKKAQICMDYNQPQIPYRIVYDSEFSLHNWVQQLDLVCASDNQIGALGSMYFAGWTLSSTFVPIIADKKGRRVALLLSLGLLIVTTVLTMTSTSLNFTTIVMFFMGLTGNGLASISYIYVLEGITPNWKSVVGSISCASAYCLPMILSLYFQFLSTDYMYIMTAGLIIQIVSFCLLAFYLEESPLFLLKKGEIEKATQILSRIHSINTGIAHSATTIPLLKMGDLNQKQNIEEGPSQYNQKQEQKTILQQLKDKALLKSLMLMIVQWCTVSFSYFMMGFQMKYIPGNVYFNLILGSIADVLGTFISAIMYQKFGAKYAFIGQISISIFGGVMMLLLAQYVSLIPIFVMFTKLGSSGFFNLVFLVNADIFPTLFAATAMGICNLFGRTFSIGAPIIAEQTQPIPMVIFVLLNSAALICALGLPTKKQNQEKTK